jgi:hypothetical protein
MMVFVLIIVAVLILTRSPVGEALSRRVAGEGRRDPEWMEAVEELQASVEDLREELRETQERLEFAERLLAGEPTRDRRGLEGGALVIDRSV